VDFCPRPLAQAEREKRVKVVEQKLRRIEARCGTAQEAADEAFEPLAEALDGLERGLQKERRAREEFVLGQSAGMKEMEQNLRAELDAMQQGRREGEEWATAELQRLYEQVRGEHSESMARARGLQEENDGALGALLPEVRGKLGLLRREREEAEDAVLKALFEFSNNLQTELTNERRDRGEAEDVLLQLLEETCEKIQLLGTM